MPRDVARARAPLPGAPAGRGGDRGAAPRGRERPIRRSCAAAPSPRCASCSRASPIGGRWCSPSTICSGATSTPPRCSPRSCARPMRRRCCWWRRCRSEDREASPFLRALRAQLARYGGDVREVARRAARPRRRARPGAGAARRPRRRPRAQAAHIAARGRRQPVLRRRAGAPRARRRSAGARAALARRRPARASAPPAGRRAPPARRRRRRRPADPALAVALRAAEVRRRQPRWRCSRRRTWCARSGAREHASSSATTIASARPRCALLGADELRYVHLPPGHRARGLAAAGRRGAGGPLPRGGRARARRRVRRSGRRARRRDAGLRSRGAALSLRARARPAAERRRRRCACASATRWPTPAAAPRRARRTWPPPSTRAAGRGARPAAPRRQPAPASRPRAAGKERARQRPRRGRDEAGARRRRGRSSSLLWQRARIRLRGLRFRERDESQVAGRAAHARRRRVRGDDRASAWSTASAPPTSRRASSCSRSTPASRSRLVRALTAEAGFVSMGGTRSAARCGARARRARRRDQAGRHARGARLCAPAAAASSRSRRAAGATRTPSAPRRSRSSAIAAPGSPGSRHLTQIFAVFALALLGRVRELVLAAPDADQGGARARRSVHRDQPAVRRRLLRRAGLRSAGAGARADRRGVARWNISDAVQLPHFNAVMSEIVIDLYANEPARAWERLEARQQSFAKAQLLRAQPLRISVLYSRTRAAIGRAVAGERAFLRHALADARALERERVGYAAAQAVLTRAQVALIEGDARATALLEDAERRYAACDQAMYVAAVRWVRGKHVGGDAGAELVTRSEDFCRQERIHQPLRMLSTLAPSALLFESGAALSLIRPGPFVAAGCRRRRGAPPGFRARCRAAAPPASGCRRSGPARRRCAGARTRRPRRAARLRRCAARGWCAPTRRTRSTLGGAAPAPSTVAPIFSTGRCSTPMGPAPHKRTARSMTLRSSRMLPGQL